MSHFEYVSVAIALLSALAIGRLLSGFSPALDRNRRYWLHLGWVVALILVCVTQWWGLWRMRDVSWTPLRFLWVLSMPGLLYIQAAVLLSDNPAGVESFRIHYFERRVRFFSVALVSAIVTGLSPWIFGHVPWLSPAPVHSIAVALACIATTGLVVKNSAVHAVLVALSLVIAIASFVIAPPFATAA